MTLFGYPEAELLGRTYKDLTHPDDLEANAALFDDMLAGRCSHAKIAKRYIKKNGRGDLDAVEHIHYAQAVR